MAVDPGAVADGGTLDPVLAGRGTQHAGPRRADALNIGRRVTKAKDAGLSGARPIHTLTRAAYKLRSSLIVPHARGPLPPASIAVEKKS